MGVYLFKMQNWYYEGHQLKIPRICWQWSYTDIDFKFSIEMYLFLYTLHIFL